MNSFDARDWAKQFVEHVKRIPSIATDEETMVSWFASALMRGYDEHQREVTDVIKTGAMILLAAATESLKGGQHDGPCDNDPDSDDSTKWGPCQKHMATSDTRHNALETAVEKMRELVK